MINEKFINECKNRANANRLGKITINGIEKPITNSDNLQSFSIDSGCYVDGNIIGSVYAKCLNASFITDIADLSEKSIYAQIGVKYDDSKAEYISMGKYRVERPNNEITANMSQITAYDDLYTNLYNKYVCGIDYSKGNITVRDLYIDICNQLGLTPKTTSFINDNIPIEDNPFTNGEKNRTVLQTVCKISCSFVDVDVETNEIDLCWLSQSEEPDYTFYKNDYVSTEGGQVVCGPINCLIIKNSQIDSENVTKKDDKDIAINGEHSITISEDYILHNEELRQLAINNIWNRVHGMKYVDCKLTTYYGKPFLKLGNKIRVYIDDNNTKYFDTYVLKHNFTYDGSFNSIIESPALTQQEIKSKQDISLGQALLNTQIDVDKQNKRITALVQETSATQEKVTQLEETTNGIKTSVSTVEKDLATTNSNLEQTNKNVDALSGKIDGVSADFTDFKDNEYVKSIENLQDQIDGAIQFWNGSAIPTINNYPANEWTTENDRNNHRADIYTVIEDVNGELKQGKSYRFDKVGDTWQWIELTDNELSAVQALAQQALDKSNKNADNIEVLSKKTSELEQTDEKISASVEELSNQYEQDMTVENKAIGYPIVVEDAGQYNVEELKVYGNSEQDTRSDKNKFAITQGGSGYGITATYNEDGTFNFKGTASSSASTDGSTLLSHYFTFDEMGVENGKTYTISSNKTIPEGLGVRFEVYNESDSGAYTWVRVVIGQMDNARPVRYGTLNTEGGNRIRLSFQVFKDAVIDIENIGFQIEEGTVATDWQPYGAMPSPEFPSEIRNVEPIENIFFTDIWEKKIFSSNLPVGADASQYITINSFDGNNVNFTINQNEWLEVISKPIKLKPNTKYQIFYERNNSDNTDITRCFIYNYNINNSKYSINRIGVESGNNKYSFDFTTNSDDYIVIGFTVGNASTDRICNIKNIMISEENSSYVPYGHWLKGKITGRNLLNLSNISNFSSYGLTGSYINNNIIVKGTNTYQNAHAIVTWQNIIDINNLQNKLEKGKTYVISKDNDLVYDLYFQINYTPQGSSSQTGLVTFHLDREKEKEFTVPFDLDIINMCFLGVNKGATTIDAEFSLSISEKRNEKIEYEPYKEKEFLYNMNKYNEEGNVVGYYELSKINDTRDDLDFVSGKFTEKIGKIILTGDENFSMPSRFDKTTHYFEYVLSNKFPIFPTIMTPNNQLCNYFKIGNPYTENTFDSFWVFYNTTSQSNVVRFGFKDEKFATSVDFKKWLKTLYNSGNPVIIYYIMETPQQYQLKPINVELFKGYNRITLEDKYGIVEELEMTYLTDSKLNGQYATKTELKLTADSITSEVNKKVSTDNFNTTVEDISNKMTQTANETNSTLQEILNTNDEQETKINSLTQTANGLNIEISEQKKSYDSLNGKLVDIEGTLKDMTFDFSTKGLAIGTSTDANNSLLDNTGIKVYNYDKLNAIFNNRGSGLDKLIVTGTAQIGYLKFVKSTKNGKPGTKIFYVKKSIESLEDLL